MYGNEDDEEDGPKSSFETYLAEGEKLSNKGYYQKALEAITMVSSTASYSAHLDID